MIREGLLVGSAVLQDAESGETAVGIGVRLERMDAGVYKQMMVVYR